MKHINRWSPLSLSSTVSLRNRIVVPAMASQTARVDGQATPETIAHYTRLAESGAGLIIGEYTFVNPNGRCEENQLGASSDVHIPGLAAMARVIKQSGAVAGLQLVHGGGKTRKELTGGVLLGPSAVPVPAKGVVFDVPTVMTLADIDDLRTSYIEAAQRAVTAGFDLVELHGAHGYGFNQWLSPVTNRRTDTYGGSLQNRTRLLREVVTDIRARFPDLILTARLPGQDFVEGGLSIADMQSVSKDLVRDGLAIVSVSSGLGGWRRPGGRHSQGYLIEEARAIQANIDRPVIGVGGIETGDYIDSILTNKSISLAAVGRAILANPALWRQQNLGERYDLEHTVS